MANEQDLRFRLLVESGQLRRLQGELRQTIADLEGIGAAGTTGGTTAAAGLQRVQKAAGDVARARVASAAVTRRASLQELQALQQIARTAKRGSAEQIEANRLAANSARRLGLVQLEASNRAAVGWRRDELALNRLTRGALAGSGLFGRFGRTLAFGSLGFLGGATIIDQLKRTAQATDQAQQTEQSFERQLDASGISAARYGKRIHEVILAQSDLANVSDTLVQQSLTDLIRATGDVTQAERLNALALDISAAKHIPVVTVANALGKAYNGQATALSRLVGGLPKGIAGLDAIRIAQQRFAGQAEAAASRNTSAFTRFGNAVERIRIRFGTGFLPFFTRDLNELARKLNDPGTTAAAERLGERIGKDVEGALRDVVAFVHDNWGEIKTDFHDAETILANSATAAQDLASGLHEIASIVPGKNSLIRLLVEAGLVKHFFFRGKGGGAAAGGEAGVASGLGDAVATGAGFAAGSSILKRVFTRGPSAVTSRVFQSVGKDAPAVRLTGAGKAAEEAGTLLTRVRGLSGFAKAGVITIAFDLVTNKKDRNSIINNLLGGHGSVADRIKHALHIPDAVPLIPAGELPLAPIARALDFHPFGIGASHHEPAATDAFGIKRLLDAASKAADAAAAHFNERITNAAQAAAEKTKEAFKTAFKEVEQRALEASDARTSTILDAFDRSTQRMEDKLRVTVRVAGEVFTVGKDQKTPAERELDALDKIQERHHFQRDIFDANQARVRAEQVGDPTAIRDAQRAQQDARAEKRRFGLEGQAERERKAADAALKAADDRLRRQRDIERRDLAERRKLEREDLQRQLDAQKAAFDKGKKTADQAQAAIIGVLRKHGLGYKQAGHDLGKAFADAFTAALNRLSAKGGAVDKAADNLEKRLEEAGARAAGKIAAALGIVPDKKTGRKSGGSLFHLGSPFATGGVVEGPAGKDVVLGRLTRGEIVFADPEQQRLKKMLGFQGNAEGLFRHVRGFAGGGVVGSNDPPVGGSRFDKLMRDLEELLRRTLVRQSRETQADARLLGTKGHLTDAQRRALDPVHIESLVQHSAARNLPLEQKLELESRLAQEEAHPVRSGLIRPTPTGTRPGRGRPLPQSHVGIPSGAFAAGGGDMFVERLTVVANDPSELVSKLRRRAKSNSREWARAGTRRVGTDERRASDTRLGV